MRSSLVSLVTPPVLCVYCPSLVSPLGISRVLCSHRLSPSPSRAPLAIRGSIPVCLLRMCSCSVFLSVTCNFSFSMMMIRVPPIGPRVSLLCSFSVFLAVTSLCRYNDDNDNDRCTPERRHLLPTPRQRGHSPQPQRHTAACTGCPHHHETRAKGKESVYPSRLASRSSVSVGSLPCVTRDTIAHALFFANNTA